MQFDSGLWGDSESEHEINNSGVIIGVKSYIRMAVFFSMSLYSTTQIGLGFMDFYCHVCSRFRKKHKLQVMRFLPQWRTPISCSMGHVINTIENCSMWIKAESFIFLMEKFIYEINLNDNCDNSTVRYFEFFLRLPTNSSHVAWKLHHFNIPPTRVKFLNPWNNTL